ncbi:MAG: helix-turn-helix transcriptional regulator [Actinomycetota bacterium]
MSTAPSRTDAQLRDAGQLASTRDADGNPVHHGWPPCGGRRRWMAPFILVLLAGADAHGYALIGGLREMGVSEGEIDPGQVYRTLRCMEKLGHVRSTWSLQATGPAHRDYEITDAGRDALDEWAAVMTERARLIHEFDAARERAMGCTTPETEHEEEP